MSAGTHLGAVHAAVHNQAAQVAGHGVATFAVASWIWSVVTGYGMTILGAIALMLSIAWYSVTLWETDTVKQWVARRRARRAAKLKAALEALMALQAMDRS